MSQALQLNLSLVLPELESGDRCLQHFFELLRGQTGIEHAHPVEIDSTPQVCLHYDPAHLSAEQVRTLAGSTAQALRDRFRHEYLPLPAAGASTPAALVATLEQLRGVLHVHIDTPSQRLLVAYDTQQVQRPAIEQVLAGLAAPAAESCAGSCCHHHSTAPSFLPERLREHWSLFLVGLCGLFLLTGWLGQQFLGMPAALAQALFVAAYLAGGYEVAIHAVPGLLKGRFDTDVLMLAAAAGAAALGEWSEGALLLLLFGLGHAGERFALDRARNAVGALGALMPRTAQLRRGAELVDVDVETLQPGDLVLVRPGARLPADGLISNGSSTIDQSAITGESLPVARQPGDPVFAGTVNGAAALEVYVTRPSADNTLSRIMRLVTEAQSQQSPTQRLTERFTAWFVPAVLVASALLMVLPPLLGWRTFAQSFYDAMILLVAASPCALALGTPATVLAGIAQAARNGVLIKGGVHLENLGALRVIAFDKTGTLTEGHFAVTDRVALAGSSPTELLGVAAAIEQHANHPLAQSVVAAAQSAGLELPSAGDAEQVAGLGVRGIVAGQPTLVGALRLFDPAHPDYPAAAQQVAALEAAGRTTVVVGWSERILGVLGLTDQARRAAGTTLAQLRQQGVQHLVMLTGDNRAAAEQVAGTLGISDTRAGLLPEDKLAAIRGLTAQHGALAMVGDGVNDAPALALATVGVAMGGAGTAVALETADVALMGDDLSKLPFAVGLGRASRAIIRQNLAIALAVIVLLLGSALLGVAQLGWAVALHEGSTLLVVLNALRLLGYRREA